MINWNRFFKGISKYFVVLGFTLFNSSSAQLFTDNIVDVEITAGVQYLKVNENHFRGTASLNLTLGDMYLGAGILGSSDVKLDIGYHLINTDEFVLTPGYQRISFMVDHAFANTLFLQSQFMISDNSFIKIRGAYIFSQNANIKMAFTPQIEYGFRFDMTGNSMGRDRGNSWSSWFSDIW
jgi:hypothetical protein